MDVTPLIRANAQVIQSYRGGIFKISNTIYEAAVLVTADESLAWHPSSSLEPQDFAPLVGRNIEIVLLGTGEKMMRISPKLRDAVKNAYGFSVDSMDTGAACRTFNVLMAEGRRVAAALMPFGEKDV